jgi:hypothetical protein
MAAGTMISYHRIQRRESYAIPDKNFVILANFLLFSKIYIARCNEIYGTLITRIKLILADFL